MNRNVRNARLTGTAEAHRIHRMMESRERVEATDGQVDVFGILAELEVLVVFKPLDGLLGAFLKQEAPGVIISTKRPYSVQRFTGAHELGHAVLDHDPSLDSPGVLRRAAIGYIPTGTGNFRAYLQEIEADAFAGELLAPRWLLIYHAKRQGWQASQLSDPDVAYQMALRCGCSYEATLRSLARNSLISETQVDAALKAKPKALKARLRGEAEWINPWSDVWRLTERDQGHRVPAADGDMLRVGLLQKSAAGYRWTANEVDPGLLLLMEDVRITTATVGGPSEKLWYYRAGGEGLAVASYAERRPWEAAAVAAATFEVNIKPVEKGLSRANRARLVVA